ncbi:NAD(P)-dependent glycerol-3-phosphate dehydrogenase [Myxococcus sp. CA051A]|uniref:Glycerol-3-phosphate dehydrogenase [NAD(P)+] n=1 Tax=Myxococcus llanfairpwllgwyngyllgogerychwyrndrobwllllantysiliogogogochensis TaxID=2590453 RepID=A0A540WHX1_9BACT|nr:MULTISPECIES: NAD(P)H-dependent glycerol-3-phosphate dehydrogenase [Myxococcus]NTX05015.1 NAD(P)-dependent glycerol-3-phosphate dehydrogenase [Myxococcus sp. CA040A]NTX15369.1 NAD(P)-dependent glycerol-3-phosphate dehydrogenase [Myxococcus sp. CA056]NTX37877.1 NAD(P)-dependent glycerol-3-phosphate dehydrogenase [Myxococcus sp. CA033]NTX58800.1 NAD(P)-dependent glycerol-3-phosphate dehydrogenase [Myxococcus sp. CA039A]NTX61527.1 NAD(P)-dependent glycerol-3-phosphate dehydrogenase [Myxococcus
MRGSVIGSGSFGTALANVLAVNCEEVRLWGREPTVVEAINTRHENPTYLPGIPISERVRATQDLEEALAGAEMVVLATPSHATREVLARAKAFLPRNVPIITVSKGIENETLLTMTELLEDCLPEEFHPYIAVLSGPSFAKELARRMPTVVTIASHWDKVAVRCQKALQTETFRSYTSTDVVGVQYGGALKNVIAIAAGMADGLGMGHNARAAIITRGLAEITRLAVRKGANPLTLSGLSGMGDLVLTCTGELSRNRHVGMELGKGRKLPDILGQMKEVAEGVKTARSARDLSLKTGVELPICQQVYLIAYEDKNAKMAVVDLMTRQPKSELV